MPPKGGFFNDGRESALGEYVFAQDTSQLRNNPGAILKKINDFVNTKGMMTFRDNKIAVSRQVLEVLDPKPKVIVELGTYVGNSAIAWGAMLQDFHTVDTTAGCKVFSMELEPNFVTIARSLVDLAGLNDLVEIIQGESAKSIQLLKTSGRIQSIDMLFIDHWEKFYLSDLQLCEDLGLLRKGTTIIADNTDIPGAPDYVEYVRSGGSKGYVYETKTLRTTEEVGKPNVLEVTTVVDTP